MDLQTRGEWAELDNVDLIHLLLACGSIYSASALETESVGSNPGHGEVVFSGLFSSFPPCDFSPSQCLLACEFRFTTVYGRGKKRINMEKSLQPHLWRQNSEVSAMYGKGAKMS